MVDPSPAPTDPPRWLDERERAAWMEIVVLVTRLPALLDTQLQRDAGLSHYEYGVLSTLSAAPEGTVQMADVAYFAGSSVSRLSHVVSRLEQRGYVKRARRRGGRGRATDLTLTDAGRALVEQAAPGHVGEVRRLVIDHLDAAQLEALTAILRTLRPGLGAPPATGTGDETPT